VNIEPIVPFRQELIVLDQKHTMEPMVTKVKEVAYRAFAQRLHEACTDAGIPPGRGRATQVGSLVDVGYKGATKWLDGIGMPDMGNATILAQALGVCFEWLMTGRGPKKLDGAQKAAEEPGTYRIQPSAKNLAGAIEVFEAVLPPSRYIVPPGKKAESIIQIYNCTKTDGSLDMTRVLSLVKPIKTRYETADRKDAGRRKRSS
jgi:hypothetical protein